MYTQKRPELIWYPFVVKIYNKNTVKPVVSGHKKEDQTLFFADRLSLIECQKYCIMLKESNMQYFRPSISYHLSSRPLFLSIFNGRYGRFYCMCKCVRKEGLWFVCFYISGAPKGSVDIGSGELGIEPATPGLQGIALITSPRHRYSGRFTHWLLDT